MYHMLDGDPISHGDGTAGTLATTSLIAVNFFAETNRLEPLVAVFLITYKGWDVVWVGYLSVVMNMLMLVLQTPAGEFMDRTSNKRAITAFALAVAAVTTSSVAWTSDVYAVIALKAVEGAAACIFLPALMALLLGVTPNDDVPRMVSLTETSNKIGSVLFTVGTGLISYYAYPDVSSVFYLLAAGGLLSAFFVMMIPLADIDDHRARGDVADDAAHDKSTRQHYRDLLTNRGIVMFAVLTFCYHLSNAGVLPLVAQLVASEDERNSLVFTSGMLGITYFVQAPTAYWVGKTYQRFGYKNLLLLGHFVLPVRCTILALLAIYYPNKWLIAATQVFEGIGAGIYDTIMPLVVKQLCEGYGHFGFTFGFIVTCWRVGHGLSVLLLEGVLKASDHSFEAPFIVAAGMGLLCCLLLLFGVDVPTPTPKGDEDGDGRSDLDAIEDSDVVNDDEDGVVVEHLPHSSTDIKTGISTTV